MQGGRLLAFDIMRIVSVGLIVASHVGIIAHQFVIPSVYLASWGGVGVTLLLVVSGAVLEYNYRSISSASEFGSFLFRRMTRIYPAYWLSLVIALVVSATSLASLSDGTWLLQVSGFAAFANIWGGGINGVGWFIGLIVALYLLFPALSAFCRRSPHLFFVSMLLVSATTRYYIFTNQIGLRAYDWFPLCRIFEFGLGIFIVRMSLYPKTTYENMPIRTLADMSFYVFLVHFPIVYVWRVSPAIFLVSTLALAYALMLADGWVQKRIIKNVERRVFAERGDMIRTCP